MEVLLKRCEISRNKRFYFLILEMKIHFIKLRWIDRAIIINIDLDDVKKRANLQNVIGRLSLGVLLYLFYNQ